MNIQELLTDLGGAAKVARSLKSRSKKRRGQALTTAAVCMWKRVPVEHVQTIVKMSGGKFTAEQLRPDIFKRAA